MKTIFSRNILLGSYAQILKSLLPKRGFALNLVLKQEFLELGKNLRYWYSSSRLLDFAIFARQYSRGFIFAIKRFQLYWDQDELISILQ